MGNLFIKRYFYRETLLKLNRFAESNLQYLNDADFLKMGHSWPLFLYFIFSIRLSENIQYKFCRWLDLNHGPLKPLYQLSHNTAQMSLTFVCNIFEARLVHL